jgi:hypothetical protein
LEGGGVFKLPWLTVSPTGNITHLTLGREGYLRSHGFGLAMERALGDRLSTSLESAWQREDYFAITESTAAPERTGPRVNLLAGLRYILHPTMQLGLQAGYENKDIRGSADYNGYEGGSLTGSHTWLLGHGQFLLSSLTWTRNIYDEPDTAISARIRRDHQLRGRVAYGAPLVLLAGWWLPDAWLADTTAIVSFEQFRSLSNITNYTYSNSKLDLLLTRRFEF